MKNLLDRYRTREPKTLDDLFVTPSSRLWDNYEAYCEKCTEEFNELTDYAVSTTDYPDLCKVTKHYLFVYDGLKMGFKRSEKLSGFPCVGMGYTKARFQMFRKSINALLEIPVILMSHDSEKRAPVYGEVYCVPPEVIAEMDWNESNGILANRRRIAIDAVINKEGETKQIWAWVYIHNMAYYTTRMDTLRPADMLTANSGGLKYYNFMKKYEINIQ